MRPAALIFDVDGTIAETEDIHRRAFNASFAQAGLNWHWDVPLYRRLLQTAGGKERLRRFADETARDCLSDAQIAALHAAKTTLYTAMIAAGEATFRPGVAPLMAAARARGIKLGIATTTSTANIDALLRRLIGPDWREGFAAVAGAEEAPRKKPAPDVYVAALRMLGLPPSACLAIEDSRNGVCAARAAGLRVLVTRSLYFDSEDIDEADLVSASLEDTAARAYLRARDLGW